MTTKPHILEIEDSPELKQATKKRPKREQAFIDYLETTRDKLIAKRDALSVQIKDIDDKLLPFLAEK
jgi:hypothetical protein